MREKRLLHFLGQIDETYIEEADRLCKKKGKLHRFRHPILWAGSMAAVLIAAVFGRIFFWTDGGLFHPASVAAAYEPDYTAHYDGSKLDEAYLGAIRSFSAKAGNVLLDSSDTTAYSPTALYTALSMVAELADGSSLDALLDILDTQSTEQLQQYSGDLWRYLCNNPDRKAPGKVTVANSLWLNQDYTFNGETLQNLADYYYVASYTGDMEKDIPKLASDWVKKQTNHLLDCQINPTVRTMAVLLSAIYFYDEWEEKFNESITTEGIFLVGEDETVRCNYMKRSQDGWAYYQGDGITASIQYFKNGGKMLFILPDKENSPEGVLSDPVLLSSVLGWEGLEKKTGTVEWSIPRFTLSSTLDLQDGLTALGLGELFDSNGNPLCKLSDEVPVFIGHAEQGTAISIDEKGCEAASYVKIEAMSGGAMPPDDLVYMTLSRPFIFAILSENDVPLFLGVINNPNS